MPKQENSTFAWKKQSAFSQSTCRLIFCKHRSTTKFPSRFSFISYMQLIQAPSFGQICSHSRKCSCLVCSRSCPFFLLEYICVWVTPYLLSPWQRRGPTVSLASEPGLFVSPTATWLTGRCSLYVKRPESSLLEKSDTYIFKNLSYKMFGRVFSLFIRCF